MLIIIIIIIFKIIIIIICPAKSASVVKRAVLTLQLYVSEGSWTTSSKAGEGVC